MNPARAVLATVACGLVLMLVTRELNHAFSGAALSVFAWGLPVAFAALRLDFTSGWRSVVLLGLMTDALAPVPFGTHAVIFLSLFVLIYRTRQRVPRDETLVGVVYAVVATVIIYLTLSLALVWHAPLPGRQVGRLFSEAGLSALLVALLGPWFLALNEHALSWLGVDLRRETRSLV